MDNGIRYSVSVKHLKSFDYEHRTVTYDRVIGIYDTLDDAIDNFIKIVRCEDSSSESDIKNVVEELRGSEDVFDKEGPYSFVFKNMHDYPKFYFGPGAYTIEKRRLS